MLQIGQFFHFCQAFGGAMAPLAPPPWSRLCQIGDGAWRRSRTGTKPTVGPGAIKVWRGGGQPVYHGHSKAFDVRILLIHPCCLSWLYVIIPYYNVYCFQAWSHDNAILYIVLYCKSIYIWIYIYMYIYIYIYIYNTINYFMAWVQYENLFAYG